MSVDESYIFKFHCVAVVLAAPLCFHDLMTDCSLIVKFRDYFNFLDVPSRY